ncbi:EamA family transporter RarD [Pseudaminobacter arsenicus]|uniref:EamA family transporter RarD n=1 Tax=Borborobacter arsenicus TaxID=1851146 RepID=A0A432V2K5_9HYPH|nr:EamA family transporter RarD [Pseudaminobacter arsenicus]RUM96411.1 EamA family transporter RarD [Pseudaminobacter arsenicus]
MTVQTTTSSDPASRGFFYALSAYSLWGFLPLFLKAVAHIPATEVVAHRILWSVPVAGVVLLVLGRTKDVMAALRSPRTMVMAAVTAAIIALNWGIYVWAIAVERTVESALGYYINPLVSVAMGAVLLGERMNRMQMAAIGLATVAVCFLAVDAGGVPWVSLSLAFTFATYGYLRKTLPIGPSQGFFLEVLILCLPALAYVVWLQMRGESHLLPSQPYDFALLLACGPITAVPLLLYAFGAKLLRLSTLGLMQYIAPTMIFLIAIFVFNEPFDGVRVVAFALIWSALAIYTWSTFFVHERPAVAEQVVTPDK